MDEEQSESLLAPTPEFLASVKVFPLIPSIKRDVELNLVFIADTALSWEQLTASDINFAIVRPLVFKYARLDNMSAVYACFVVRSHFLSEAEQGLAYSGVMLSRASLCEILAIKLLGTFASSRIRLVAVLTASWSPLAGAPPDITQEVRGLIGDDEQYDPQCALEMAIATEAKAFLASPVVQTIVNDIYAGRVVFSMSSNHSVLADNYKPRAIEIYDGRKAPFLDHYRLRVPRYGAILEFLNFALLLTTFLLCLSNQQVERLTAFEIVFIIFATAFTLEEYTASKEHGWGTVLTDDVIKTVYIANMWNVFDTSFVVVFLTYLGFRIKGLVHHDVSNNVVVLALRAMIAEFIFFVGIAAICFSGLLFTLHSLAADTWSVKAIAWLMVQIWFGNTYLSFGQAKSFHPIFGPILMTGFAALSNTLLLTILISILSNTFARIDANAKQESFPTLIVIWIYERYLAQGQWRDNSPDAANSMYSRFTRKMKSLPLFDLLGTHSTDIYDAIFDVEMSHDTDIFFDSEDEMPASHFLSSHDSLHFPPSHGTAPQTAPIPQFESPTPRIRRHASLPRSTLLGRSKSRRDGLSPSVSPRSRKITLPAMASSTSGEIPTIGPHSPLSRLYLGRNNASATQLDRVNSAAARVEALLEDVRGLPVNRLKDEMKELQDRQARIENLLLMLTRDGLGDDGGTPRK
ncbi:predicted protein [Postia placenta Mad-698-R]|uniref:Polycystin cation channel PKD1/PKD2 domain-containing protein n=1 Tax=Postia placenta MAD-698-R-SB12 TaxID=670580 RepID=A0A1X6MQS5_9APHY|nr:hypothetical protein POSPLADRAFT_1151880 [Postia placenta MAD-698-R-SB12]EED84303.1 predicted protein [Postia placenta Mad-698-R]OSX58725.1 hypothetical protein POSPLADRAFT_1151880 [Postia placenta MAD-698-R-SB12]